MDTSAPVRPSGAAAIDERRRHFRLSANLPVDILLSPANAKPLRRISANVSAGGIYFFSHEDDPVHPGQRIGLRIAVPAAVGRMSTETVLEGQATVLRVEPPDIGGRLSDRVGVACEFTSPLRFA